jgi:type III restriction enzyme
MKFKFKIQKYQTDAVDSITNVFNGQMHNDGVKHTVNIGESKRTKEKSFVNADLDINSDEYDLGFANAKIELTNEKLLKNIQLIQQNANIRVSECLKTVFGRPALDIEMETGTGKTYVYIKSIFELNKRYGWSKFIVIVPSVAIREGVRKSFEITQEHFMEQYSKKARYFIYNSSKLQDIETFSSSAKINVMIINSQAFNATGKDARRIDMKLDDFAGRKPIEVIAKSRPIIILDEPQKLGGQATQTKLATFNPLFTMYFSATHKVEHNLIYVLDALESFNQRLVKKIEVKGIEIKNLRGSESYLYLSQIILSKDKAPHARIELEIDYKNKINRETRIFKKGDNLFNISKNMYQYNGFVITDISPITNEVTFQNGAVITAGIAYGNPIEIDIRRVQIRETIISHFDKEEENFDKDIKTLSLFFIDEVGKYKGYDENGDEFYGEYARVFESEYLAELSTRMKLLNPNSNYAKYLQSLDGKKTHSGYFSIDKKTGRVTTPSIIGRGEDKGLSDDISAYDLILKNKERLLSLEEPTRFIFSHSALREGWDNPNVFQICTLKNSDNTITKRQEVGRGMRICVNKDGDRQDEQAVGIKGVHDINKLTIIASESYANFTDALQKEIKENLCNRPTKADQAYFIGKKIVDNDGNITEIRSELAKKLHAYLVLNDYIDENSGIKQEYYTAKDNGTLAMLPLVFLPYSENIHKLIQSVYTGILPDEMVENGNKSKISANPLNNNFYKSRFQELWNLINHKYTYDVSFDSDELIAKAVECLDNKLFVTQLRYSLTTGSQKGITEFSAGKTSTYELDIAPSRVEYDLIGKIASETTLTRKTVAAILKKISAKVYSFYSVNPEEFIKKAIMLINEQKASLTVDHITYNKTDDCYDIDIFNAEKHRAEFEKAFSASKSVQDYVFTDGYARDGNSIEQRFVNELESRTEVAVYAKLPKGFKIPTPMGDYAPDWAIAFNEGSVKHVYFIAETKGTLSSLEQRPLEAGKIKCCHRLFNELELCGSNVKYHGVTSYEDLIGAMNNV